MTQDSSARKHHSFILIHGGYHGGWCWKHVAADLRARGHEVHVPTLTGLGERSHLITVGPDLDTWVDDVAQVMKFDDLDDAILVGHSFAGSILSTLADRLPQRIRHMVYLDALVLESGESSADRAPERVEQLRQQALQLGGGVAIPPLDPTYFGISDPEMATWIKTKLTSHPLQTYYSRLSLKNPLGNGVPATYIACSNPMFATNAKSREIAKTVPRWSYQEIPTGHDAMLLAPRELADMLHEIAGRA